MGVLEKSGASAGDRVRVHKREQVFEGVLLPGEDNKILLIKLDSGYNVGVSVDSSVKVEKLAAAKAVLGKAVSAKIERGKDLPEIAFVATGGTIASRVDYSTGAVTGSMTPEEIFSVAPELAQAVSLKSVSSPIRLQSEDLTPKEWKTIAETIAKDLNSGCIGAIVAHGTDTMHYTAAALSFMLRDLNKPVALVGAQRSPDRGSFDGAMNLLCAAHYAKSDFAEVAIVMHGTSSDDYCLAHRGTKVRKMHTTRRDAFKSVNATPLAKIFTDGKIEQLNADAKKRNVAAGKVEVDAAFEEKTALVKVFPGASPEIMEFFVEKKYKGVVLEAFALGHVPTIMAEGSKHKSWIPAIKRAIDSGVSIAVATQCLYGTTNPFVYSNLRAVSSLGAIYCKDMLPETAYVKLGWVLGHFKKENAEGVKEMMEKNIAGEYNERLTEADFL